MDKPLGLSTYRWNNNVKSLLLLGALPVLLLGLVWLFLFITGLLSTGSDGFVDINKVRESTNIVLSDSGPYSPFFYATVLMRVFAPFVLGASALWLSFAGLFHGTLIRRAAHARTLERRDNPEIYNLLENLCISRGLSMPKLHVIDTDVTNAFASGLSKSSYSITLTRGLIETLNRDELEAVLAHELSHIVNRDVRLLLVTTLFAGMLSFFAEMMWRGSLSSSRNPTRSKGRAGMALIVAAVLLSVGYIVSLLLRFALSRRREYLADAGAVDLTKRPEALISALQKISGNSLMVRAPSGIQAMMIDNPPGIFDLFDTHPPIEKRIAVLRLLGNLPQQGKSVIPNIG